MKRRDFFKVLFGGLAATTVAPKLNAILPPLPDPMIPAGAGLKLDWQNFVQIVEFSTESLVAGGNRIIHLPEDEDTNNIVTHLGLHYESDSPLSSIREFMGAMQLAIAARGGELNRFAGNNRLDASTHEGYHQC